MNNWRSQTNTIFVFNMILCLFVFSCSEANKGNAYKNEFKIIVSDSFRVTLTDLANGQNAVIFSIPKDSNYIITSASFDKKNKRIAVSLIENGKAHDRAQIVFLENIFPYNEIGRTQTTFNRIRSLVYSNNGDLAFVAGNRKLDDPNNICVIRNMSEDVEVVSTGRYFSDISWGYRSKMVYFSSLLDGNRNVGYIDIDSPGVINEITKGISICALEAKEKGFVLDQDANIHIIENGVVGKKIDLSEKHLDSRFVDSISCARFGDELIVQEYVKATTYKLYVIPPPYDHIFPLLPVYAMQSFEVLRK